MIIVKKELRSFNDKTKERIINDYEIYEVEGILVEGTLKTLAEKIANDYPVKSVAGWATAIAIECYRHFTLKYLESKHDS